jgi:putative MATE family efflux protein
MSAPTSDAAPVPPRASELPGHLGGLSVRRQVAVLAIWPFLEQLLGFAVGFVDTAIAGRLSVAATEAIAVGAYLGWFMNLMFGTVAIGAGALVARGIGARHHRLVRAAVGQSLVATCSLAVVLTTGLWILAPPLCATMNLTGDAWQYGVIYLRTLTWGTPPLGVMYVNAAILRNSGDTRTPFLVLALVNVVNIVTSLIFVYAPAPFGGYGVMGIALGTVVAWYVGAAVVLLVLLRRRGPLRLFAHRIRPELATLRRMLHISTPQFFDSLALWTGNFLLATLVGHLGKTIQPGALAAHIVVIRIEAISFLPGWALGQAAAALMGQYLGLGDVRRARQAVTYCWGAAVVLMGCLGLLFLTCARPLLRLITSEPSLLELGTPLLMICGPTQLFLGTAIVLENAIRGAGATRPIALLVAGSTFLVRLPLAYLIGVVWGGGVTGIWLAVCGDNILRSCLGAAYFRSGRWSRVRV